MDANVQATSSPLADRVTSVDFFRGFTMFLLAGEASLLYEHFFEFDNGVMQSFGTQLSHHEWHGLHF
jgi:predicted acyltransferase